MFRVRKLGRRFASVNYLPCHSVEWTEVAKGAFRVLILCSVSALRLQSCVRVPGRILGWVHHMRLRDADEMVFIDPS